MEKIIPIETSVGFLKGRDCIYIDTVLQNENSSLTFKGELNSNLLTDTKRNKDFLPYKLVFPQILAVFYCELDTYSNLNQPKSSMFDLIENSEWLESILIREDYDKSIYKHYRLSTYDYVFDIISIGYRLDIIQ